MWNWSLPNYTFDIPIYVLQGTIDKMANIEVTNHFYPQIVAPVKKMFIYHNTSHFISNEKPLKFVNDILSIKRTHYETCE